MTSRRAPRPSTSSNAKHRYRKRGISMIPTKFGISFTAIFLNQAYGVVHVYHHDGSVLFSHGGTEMGQGLHTKMAQVVATELDIPVSMVHLTETNTAQASNTSATAASASSDLNGMALKNACVQINESIAKFRQDAAGKGLAGVEAWKDAVHAAYFNRVQLSAIGHYRTPGIGYNWKDGTGTPFYYFTQGVAISEVELDTITVTTGSFARTFTWTSVARSTPLSTSVRSKAPSPKDSDCSPWRRRCT